MAQPSPVPQTADDHVQIAAQLRKQGKLAEALVAYEQATQTDPKNAEAYVQWARVLLRQRKHADAIAKYFEALKIEPGCITDWRWITAFAELSDEEKKKVIAQFDLHTAGKPEYASTYNSWALKLASCGQYVEADDRFQKATESDPSNWEAYLDWGNTLRERDEPAQAIEKYLAAIKIELANHNHLSLATHFILRSFVRKTTVNELELYEGWVTCFDELSKDDQAKAQTTFSEFAKSAQARLLNAPFRVPSSYSNWGLVLGDRGRYNEANERFRQAIVLDGKDPAIFKNWGDVLYRQKRYQSAIEKYLAALNIDPENDVYQNFVAALDQVSKSERSAAIDSFREIAAARNSAVAYRKMADALRTQNKLHDACTYYRQSSDLNPDAETANNWALALAGLGKRKEAAERFRDATTRQAAERVRDATTRRPEHATVYVKWGDVLFGQKQYEQALEKYLEAIKLGPEQFDYGKWVSALSKCKGQVEKRISEELWSFAQKNSAYADTYCSWGNALAEKKDHRAAIDRFQRAAELDPDHIESYKSWGNSLVEFGEFEEATRKYLKVLKLSSSQLDWIRLVRTMDELRPEARTRASDRIAGIAQTTANAALYYAWGLALQSLNRHEEAIEKFGKAVELDDEYSNALRAWGYSLFLLNRFEDAIEKLEQAIERNPSDYDAYNTWGDVLRSNRDYEGACEKHRAAIDLDPKTADGYCRYAFALSDAKNYEAAFEKFKEALATGKQLGWTYFLWGTTLAEANCYEEAYEKFRLAIKVDPDDVSATFAAHNLATHLYDQGRYILGREEWKKAREAYARTKQRAVDNFSGDYFQYYGGMLQTIFRELDEAEKIYLEGLTLVPNHVAILMSLVRLYVERSREGTDAKASALAYAAARNYCRRAERILQHELKQVESADRLLQFGQLLLSLGDYMTADEMTRAEDYLSRALAKNTNSAAIFASLGVLNSRKKEFTKAIQNFSDAFKLNPGDLETWSNVAEAYLKASTIEKTDSGLQEKAETEFRRILETAPGHVESLLGLGEVYKAMGDSTKDEDLYFRAIDQFEEGLRVSDSGQGSKMLTRKDLAAAQYSIGYTKVKLYEAALTTKDESLLYDALECFKFAIANNPQNFKAKRAAERIEKRFKRYASQKWLERYGPPVIISGAGIIFVLTQVGFVFQKPIPMGPASYAALSFGSLMFAVAGLCLPQLLKLKVAGIELEKSTVEQITTGGALGISK